MKRRRIALGIFVIFCLSLWSGLLYASSPVATTFTSRDWTYYAIQDLCLSRDIPGLTIPPELNRNQAALLVARLLQHLSGEEHLESRRFGVSKNVYLDNMIFSYNQKVTPDKALNVAQVELLYGLVLEFQQELEILGYAIQDFNLLYADSWSKETDGLFARKPLLYSDQALAAARKLEEERLTAKVSSSAASADSITEILASPVEPKGSIEPKNLWTAQFSSTGKYLPPPSSFSVEEPEPETTKPIQIGNMEVSGGLRAGTGMVQTPEGTPSDEGVAGYGISVKMGDLALKTAVDLAVDPTLVPKVASTSVDLSLDWADLFTVSAGYRQQERLQGTSEENGPPVVTSLGVSVPITSGKVHLGMTQEWGKFGSGEGSASPGGELSPNELFPKSTAELGLSYDFKNESSLRLYYRLIDFSNVEQENHKATAEFSIKF